jgi:hypothetical protein
VEYRLRVFENRVLRRDEVAGRWRKLRNEELSQLYSSPSIIRMIKWRRMRWGGHVARMRGKKNSYSLLVGEPEGKRPIGTSRHRWVDNIKMDLGGIGWRGVVCVPDYTASHATMQQSSGLIFYGPL